MNAKGLQGLIARAMKNIEKALKKIFGDEGAEKLEDSSK